MTEKEANSRTSLRVYAPTSYGLAEDPVILVSAKGNLSRAEYHLLIRRPEIKLESEIISWNYDEIGREAPKDDEQLLLDVAFELAKSRWLTLSAGEPEVGLQLNPESVRRFEIADNPERALHILSLLGFDAVFRDLMRNTYSTELKQALETISQYATLSRKKL